MKTTEPFLAVHNLRLIQDQSGVDPEIAELVVAYARPLADSGKPLVFDRCQFDGGSPEQKLLERLARENPGRDVRFLGFLAAFGGSFERRGLPVLYSVEHLCHERRIGQRKLAWLCANPRASYREFSIPKRDGRRRVILAPHGTLRTLQRWVLRAMLDQCAPHPCAHAFVRGRSIVSNARDHVGKKVVLRLDIEDFFPSIRHPAVRKVFQGIGYPYRVAITLANLCTVDGRLPQGALTSPAISNLVCVRLDRRLASLGGRLGFTYTRYADDLIFSSDDPGLPRRIPLLREMVLQEGFRLNEAKTRIMRQGGRQMVTGIVANVRPGLPRAYRRNLRAAVHRLATRGPDAVKLPSLGGTAGDPVAVLRGHIAWLRMVDPARAEQLDQRMGPSPASERAVGCRIRIRRRAVGRPCGESNPPGRG